MWKAKLLSVSYNLDKTVDSLKFTVELFHTDGRKTNKEYILYLDEMADTTLGTIKTQVTEDLGRLDKFDQIRIAQDDHAPLDPARHDSGDHARDRLDLQQFEHRVACQQRGRTVGQHPLLVSFVYKAAFNFYSFSNAAALSIIIFVILLTFSLLLMRRTKATKAAY